MPVVTVTPSSIPTTTQYNLRELVGIVLQYNPELSPEIARSFVAQSYRRIIDSRHFYGSMMKGQVTVPNAYTKGQVTVTHGVPDVSAIGSLWDNSMVGSQFRIGFSTPIYTITQVVSPTKLTLDIPWGGQSMGGTTYMIFNNIVSFGSNVKQLLAVVNQIQGYRCKLHMPQEILNIYDTWRTSTGWTYLVVDYAPGPDGSPLFELYPAPTFQQAFPFLAYVQPPDLKKDLDYPVSAVRSDVILYGALPHALRFRGKASKYFDAQTADYYQKLFDLELNKMMRNDNDIYQRDLLFEFSSYPFSQYGSDWAQSHDV